MDAPNTAMERIAAIERRVAELSAQLGQIEAALMQHALSVAILLNVFEQMMDALPGEKKTTDETHATGRH